MTILIKRKEIKPEVIDIQVKRDRDRYRKLQIVELQLEIVFCNKY